MFRAAVDLGVGRIVFASSLQAMIRLDEGRAPDAAPIVPYFPLDGDAPTNPGHNFYGLSKEFGERMLRVFSERFPQLTCTSLRFPMLAGEWFKKRLEQPVPPSALNFCEALAYLDFSDAATLANLVLERQQPGYHQYFPAQAVTATATPQRSTVSRSSSRTRRCGARSSRLTELVDLSDLERDFGFRPGPPLTVRLDRR